MPGAFKILRRGQQGQRRRRFVRCGLPRGADVGGVDSCSVRHLEIGRVAFGDRRLDDVSKAVVRPLPRAVKGRNGAVNRSPFERLEALHSSANCAIWRAAEAMLEHGVNIVAVTDRGVPGRPLRPTRMAISPGRVPRVAPMASSMLRRTCG